MNVIVYGTLRLGERAHAFMNTCKFEGTVTVDGYEMRHLGGFPGIVPNPQSAIIGELYSGVSTDLLARLDQYEGYHEGDLYGSLYLREVVPQWQAYIYVYNGKAERYPLIETGDWKRKDISHHVQSVDG